MSKMSREAQRNQSKEDSSGSDSGSEVSQEPETDRFGFIVTNGSAAGSVGPPPELVRQREAKWINLIGQWDRVLLKKSSKVKLRCQKGIPASLRAKCWPLLCGATGRMRQNKNLYESLDSQPGLQSWVDVIERDLDRQFPFHEMFLSKDGHGQRGLFRVLKAYTQFQPEDGYCQAQGPVAAVLLMNMPAEEAFWCLVQISEQYLPGYYSPLLEGVLFDATILTWVLKKTCPAAHKHLQQHGVEPLMFATDWLMCLFTRHLPFNTLVRVWDLFFCYGVRVLLQVAVVLVRRVLGRAEQRKECVGQMETLERLRGVKEQVQDEDDAFIAEVCSVPLSTKELEKRTEKELGRWRKDKPSSTFDPRGRCHGYQMAWARARQEEEARERTEREKGNLSVPLERSASTLSLSPSLLQKRWKKGGKANAGDLERGNRVVRHLSMGAKEDYRSWAGLEFRKVQGVQEEDDVLEGHEAKAEVKQAKEKELGERLEEPKVKNTPTEHRGETERAEEETKKHEEGSQPEETGSRTPPGQEEERPDNNQTAEMAPSRCEQEVKLHDEHQSQTPEEQSHGGDEQDSEVTGASEETQNPEAEDCRTSSENDGAELQTDDGTSTQLELRDCQNSREEPKEPEDVKPEDGTEAGNAPEEREDVGGETNVDQDQDPPADPQQEQEGTAETKEDRRHSAEPSAETEGEESPGQLKTKPHVPDQADVEITQTDSETETKTASLPESSRQDNEVAADAQTDTEGLTAAPEAPETCVCAQTGAGDAQMAAQTGEEAADCVPPAGQEDTLTQSPAPSEESSTQTIPSKTGAPEQPADPVPAGAAAAAETTEEVQENPAGPTSAEPTEQVQDGDSKAPASGRRSSRSSGDFCVRKSSSSKCTRRLSEDLFTSPKEVETTQPAPAQAETAAQAEQPPQPDPSKRFGLFRKLKGEQPQAAKKQKKPKMQVPKILIQDFSDVTEPERPAEDEDEAAVAAAEEKLSSRERRRRRREQERKEKEEERLKKKKEKELERERRKPRSRGKVPKQKGKSPDEEAQPAKTNSASYAESYF
ncbi:ecotropic viral integration site 5 ortholog [Kryptolebias marmoratus]|uniref:ecotropic viral integration site 5 ortholog n=1 Tax=Kryptolebias marmoratus TaxID=37003 RepID=UPI000D530CB2|nr:ecotropic viral integration site 5 ortholog [Kryptolebias marmoratus]XP_037833273.1 ecotropic viral integration site 5 ortholog [Kryptolebias marmoratus]